MEDQLTKKKLEDLSLAQEIKNHLIKINKSIVDITQICQEAVEERQSFARFLNIKLSLGQPISYDKQISPGTFTTIVDKKLLKLGLQKLMDLGLLISNQEADSKVFITPIRAGDFIEVLINFDYYIPDPKQQNELFIPHYGSLNSVNNLKKGSGLEGIIAKTISDQLNIPLKVIIQPEARQTSFVLYIHI